MQPFARCSPCFHSHPDSAPQLSLWIRRADSHGAEGPSACRRRRQREPRAALLEERKHRLQPGVIRRVPGGPVPCTWRASMLYASCTPAVPAVRQLYASCRLGRVTGGRCVRRTIPRFFPDRVRCVACQVARVASSHRVALPRGRSSAGCGAQNLACSHTQRVGLQPPGTPSLYVRMCTRATCVRACLRACLHASVRACFCVCGFRLFSIIVLQPQGTLCSHRDSLTAPSRPNSDTKHIAHLTARCVITRMAWMVRMGRAEENGHARPGPHLHQDCACAW